jgi:hypothetical protein
MSVNRHLPHLFILPEDDANRQLANGFLLNINVNSNQVRILTPARGWTHVLDDFASDHIDEMRRYENRLLVLLMDFDDHVDDRLRKVKEAIPCDLIGRVFILGARTEPEALKQVISITYERIGVAMADDCRSESCAIWAHDLFSHNEGELTRLRQVVGAWLFQI